MIPLETTDAPDLDCEGCEDHSADLCFELPLYDFWGEWLFCEDIDTCPVNLYFYPGFCLDQEAEIPF